LRRRKAAERLGVKFIETSAKSNTGIDEVFTQITRDLMSSAPTEAPAAKVNVLDAPPQKRKKGCC
jgi:Fe2+ transport system protein B